MEAKASHSVPEHSHRIRKILEDLHDALNCESKLVSAHVELCFAVEIFHISTHGWPKNLPPTGFITFNCYGSRLGASPFSIYIMGYAANGSSNTAILVIPWQQEMEDDKMSCIRISTPVIETSRAQSIVCAIRAACWASARPVLNSGHQTSGILWSYKQMRPNEAKHGMVLWMISTGKLKNIKMKLPWNTKSISQTLLHAGHFVAILVTTHVTTVDLSSPEIHSNWTAA